MSLTITITVDDKTDINSIMSKGAEDLAQYYLPEIGVRCKSITLYDNENDQKQTHNLE